MARYRLIAAHCPLRVALSLGLAITTAYADDQRLDSLAQVRALTDSVLEKANSDETEAFNLLKAPIRAAKGNSTLSLDQLDGFSRQFSSTVTQREEATGKPTGNSEFLGQTQVGSHLVRLSYLQHRTRYPFLWTFDFYRTPNGWALTAFNADSNAEQLLSR